MPGAAGERVGLSSAPGTAPEDSFAPSLERCGAAGAHKRGVRGTSRRLWVAAHLAGTCPDKVAGVVLLAPYNRLTDVAQYHMPIFPVNLLLVDRFPSQDYLRDYHGPIAVLIAGQDHVVPERFGRRLYDHYDGPKRLWKFPDENHESVMNQPPELWKQVMDFLTTKP